MRGSVGWQHATAYGWRNHTATAVTRYKYLIGPRLLARSRASHREVALAVQGLNRMIREAKSISIRR